MLSDEEKKAIETLTNKRPSEQMLISGKMCVDILVNLIRKQSKEIEELRNEVMEKELIIDGMKEDRRIAVEEIQEQYYVSKDKIKAKIEEWDMKDLTICYGGRSQGRTFQQAVRTEVKNILQSLLEKE